MAGMVRILVTLFVFGHEQMAHLVYRYPNKQALYRLSLSQDNSNIKIGWFIMKFDYLRGGSGAADRTESTLESSDSGLEFGLGKIRSDDFVDEYSQTGSSQQKVYAGDSPDSDIPALPAAKRATGPSFHYSRPLFHMSVAARMSILSIEQAAAAPAKTQPPNPRPTAGEAAAGAAAAACGSAPPTSEPVLQIVQS